MSYQNFIPTVWAEAINRELKRKLIFAEDCNRKYEGNISKMGDSVRILGVGSPTITESEGKEIVLKGPEKVEDSSVTMVINRVAYFNFKVDDIDKRQAVGGVMEALNAEASQGMAGKMDKYIASQALGKLAKLHSTAAVEITKANVLSELDRVLEMLYENDVPADGKIVATVPPWFYTKLKQAYVDLDTDNSEMLKNGRVGRYGNILVKMSNNVAKGGTDSRIMVRTPNAVAFANPMTHTEAYRPESGFSDAVKGYVLFDSKIVRPKELVVLNCKPGA